MKAEDLRNAFGSTPTSFRNEVNDILNELEERKPPRKNHRPAAGLLIAVLAALLLAGTALATGGLRLFDRQRVGAPLPEAEALVQTDLFDVDSDLVRLELEEALFDGRRAMFLLRLTPTDPEHFVLLGRVGTPAPAEKWITEQVPMRIRDVADLQRCGGLDGPLTLNNWPKEARIVACSDGREALRCKVVVGSEENEASFEDTEAQEDGSLLVWGQIDFTDAPPQTLPCNATVIVYSGKDGEIVSTVNALFELTRVGVERVARLEPLATSESARFETRFASLSSTSVQGLLTMDYACETELSFTFRDESGAELSLGQ